MDIVFISVVEHFSQPGVIMSAHKTKDGAVQALCQSLAIVVDDHNNTTGMEINKPTAENWEGVIEVLMEYHGAQYVHAELIELPVQE